MAAVAVLAPNDALFTRRGSSARLRSPMFMPPSLKDASLAKTQVGMFRNNGWQQHGMLGQMPRASSVTCLSPRASSVTCLSSRSDSPSQDYLLTPRYPRHQQQQMRTSNGGFESVLQAAKAQGKSAVCIWFHYLGGKGADWDHGLKAKIASQLPWVEWYFPDAPHKPVTNRGGAMERCWFDQIDGQVTENMATPGLEGSVSMVHSLLRQAEAHGFASNRILLGGMSQGGVLAMSAGFSYEKPLAGIIAVSAWVPPNFGAMRQPSTPLMFGNGDRDDVVPVNLARRSAQKLEQAGCSRVSKKIYPGLDHSWKDYECQDVTQFIQSVMPTTTGGGGWRHPSQIWSR